MENKKSKDANIERLRTPILLTSMLFVGGLILASFSYTSSLERDFRKVASEKAVEITFLEEVTQPDEPEIEVKIDPVLPPSPIIKIDSNSQKEPDPKIPIPDPPKIKIGKKVKVKPPVIEFPDVEAAFPGGAAELQKWINSNVS